MEDLKSKKAELEKVTRAFEDTPSGELVTSLQDACKLILDLEQMIEKQFIPCPCGLIFCSETLDHQTQAMKKESYFDSQEYFDAVSPLH